MSLSVRTNNKVHWKHAAIARSQVVSDAWEVTKAWLGHFANWILYACMVVNILQILPGVSLWPVIIATTMGIQVVTLDIAGFGLAALADHAKEEGHEAEAAQAESTSKVLIGLMIVTLLAVTIGELFPTVKTYMDYFEKVLILFRVVMTVLYGHVVGKLGRVLSLPSPAQVQQENDLLEEIRQLKQELNTVKNKPAQAIDYDEIARRIAPLVQAQAVQEPLDYDFIAERAATLVPATPPIDYREIAEHVVPLLVPPPVPTTKEIIAEIKPLLSQLVPPAAQKIAPSVPLILPGTSSKNVTSFVAPQEKNTDANVPVVQNLVVHGTSKNAPLQSEKDGTGSDAPRGIYLPPTRKKEAVHVPVKTVVPVPQKAVQGGTKVVQKSGTKKNVPLTDEQRLEAAYQDMEQRDIVPSARKLAELTGIDRRKVGPWLKQRENVVLSGAI